MESAHELRDIYKVKAGEIRSNSIVFRGFWKCVFTSSNLWGQGKLKLFRLSLLTILAFSLFACSKQEMKTQDNKGHQPPARKVLTGKLTAAYLYEQLPAYKTGSDQYQPDDAAINTIADFSSPVIITVFLGTWCPDCQREVPRFLKIMEQVKNSNIQYQLYGLDRSKRDAEGFAEKNAIEFVPTFVIFHNQEEIGRIVESPMVSIEQDLVDILSGIGK